MGKKKNISMGSESDLAKLMEEIKKQDLKSPDDIQNFLNSFIGKSLDDLPKATDKKSRSQDLVIQAQEQPVTKGKELIKQALKLNPNNVDAYIYLSNLEKDIDKAIALLNKAIEAGEKTLGEKAFEEDKGHFWGLVETRPYMRAKASLADCLLAKKEVDKAIEVYEEMLELNPNDNQGIRYLLSTFLLTKSDLSKFEKFIEKNDDENCAVWTYNNALYSFKKFGQTIKSQKALLEAYKSNKFVIDYMLGYKELPKQQPEYIGRGDENEAVSYVSGSWPIWDKTKGALDWLYEFKYKNLKN